MHGKGNFFDPRLESKDQFPVAARAKLSSVRNADDRITAKLPALQFYQLAMPAPAPPAGSFNAARAERGKELFTGKAACASCHVAPLYSEPGYAMHTGAEIGIDDFQSSRGPERRYRTTPLAGLHTRMKGGFYHDGRFPDLRAVVDHYDRHRKLRLSEAEKGHLIEFLKSL